jgi:hypothetical protein
MKLTKEQLKQIIKEELSMALNEAYRDDVGFNPFAGPDISEKERVLSNLKGTRRVALNVGDPEGAKKAHNAALVAAMEGDYEPMRQLNGYVPLIKALKSGEIKPEDLKEIPMLTDEEVEDAKRGMERREKERRMKAAARKARLRST